MRFCTVLLLFVSLVGLGSGGCKSHHPITVEGISVVEEGDVSFKASDAKFEMQFPEMPRGESHPVPGAPGTRMVILGGGDPQKSYLVTVSLAEMALATPHEITVMESGWALTSHVSDVVWSDVSLAGQPARLARGTWRDDHDNDPSHVRFSRTWFLNAPSQKRLYIVNVLAGPKGLSENDAVAIVSNFKLH